MHDEYNHKQRLMQTYIGFKVENGGDELLLERLNDVVVNTVAENPNKKFKEEHHYIEKIVNKVMEINKINNDLDTLSIIIISKMV